MVVGHGWSGKLLNQKEVEKIRRDVLSSTPEISDLEKLHSLGRWGWVVWFDCPIHRCRFSWEEGSRGKIMEMVNKAVSILIVFVLPAVFRISMN